MENNNKKLFKLLILTILAAVAFTTAWLWPEPYEAAGAEEEPEQVQPYQPQPEQNREETPQTQPLPEEPTQANEDPAEAEPPEDYSQTSAYQSPQQTSIEQPPPQPEAPPEQRSGPSDDHWRLILVSPRHPVSVDFTPPQLETISEHHQVDSRIAGSLREMIASAAGEGITLVVTSAYRPATRQAVLHNQMIDRFLDYGHDQEAAVAAASTIVLPPGTSEHQTGLAVDIVTPGHQSLTPDFAYTPAGIWLAQNAHRYGFILRYPRDAIHITGVIFEPWHFRYVGREHAAAIFEGGYILEEYLAR